MDKILSEISKYQDVISEGPGQEVAPVEEYGRGGTAASAASRVVTVRGGRGGGRGIGGGRRGRGRPPKSPQTKPTVTTTAQQPVNLPKPPIKFKPLTDEKLKSFSEKAIEILKETKDVVARSSIQGGASVSKTIKSRIASELEEALIQYDLDDDKNIIEKWVNSISNIRSSHQMNMRFMAGALVWGYKKLDTTELTLEHDASTHFSIDDPLLQNIVKQASNLQTISILDYLVLFTYISWLSFYNSDIYSSVVEDDEEE